MNDEQPSTNALRKLLAVIASLGVAALGLVLWYELKQASMSTWSGASILFMPILIGVVVGWVARRPANSGGSGLAGFATVITLLAGLGGLALQHQIEVNFFLQRMADAAFDETLNYAKRTATTQDANVLRTVMASSDVSVIGRIAAREKYARIGDFWFNRNFIHLHWIASRRMVIYGQGGPERTILEA